jgi:hypothetical protein
MVAGGGPLAPLGCLGLGDLGGGWTPWAVSLVLGGSGG